MKTISTVDAYEQTPSGAHKITFLGDKVAGTFDDEIGALAARLAGRDDANPVEVVFEQRDGKVFVKSMAEIEPPEELGGPAEAEVAAPQDGTPDPTLDDVIVTIRNAPAALLVNEIGERLARLEGLDK